MQSNLHRSLLIDRRSIGAGSTPIAPPAGRFTGMSASQQAPAASQEGTPQKANPFANISFASSAPTPSKAAFSFGAPAPADPTQSKPLFGAPPSAVKPSAPSNGFSFGSDSAKQSTGSKALFASDEQPKAKEAAKATLPSFSSPPSSKVGPSSDKLRELNKGFFEWVKLAWENGHIANDWSMQMREYEEKVAKIVEEMGQENDGDDDAGAAGSETGDVSASASGKDEAKTTFSFGASAPAPAVETPKFSFGSSAPAPAAPSATSFSFGGSSSASSTSAPPAGTFSFGGSAPAPAAESSKPFSFGNIPPPTNVAPANAANDNDDPTSNPDDGKIEEVEKEKNADEDVLYEATAKPMKLKPSNEWQKYGAGECRLYKHKTTSKHRIVMRNKIGKVQFNVAISAAMKFTKEVKDGKKGKLAYIKFVGIEDAKEGPRPITLQVGLQDVDSFHSALSSIEE